jgi:diguanylate cyclase (GGDEF)-like protein
MVNKIEVDLEVILKTGLDISPDCLGILNQYDVVIYCNNTFASVFGITKEEAIGQTNRALLKLAWSSKQGIVIKTDNFDSWYKNIIKQHKEKSINQFETDLTDGRWFKMTRLSLENGYVLLFAVNITDLKQAQASLEKANRKIEALANTDQLTSVNNRRSFYLIAEHELQNSKHNQHSLSLILMDLDYFKKINDNYGHEAGDFVLKEFALLCKDTLRKSDSLSRIGGEEFTIILPITSSLGAYEIAEKIRSKIEAHDFYIEHLGFCINLTVSIGISSLTYAKQSVKDLLVQADIALYEAKENGRNQVIEYSNNIT